MRLAQERKVKSTEDLPPHGIREVLQDLFICDFSIVKLEPKLCPELAAKSVVEVVHIRVVLEGGERIAILAGLFIALDNEQSDGTNEPTEWKKVCNKSHMRNHSGSLVEATPGRRQGGIVPLNDHVEEHENDPPYHFSRVDRVVVSITVVRKRIIPIVRMKRRRKWTRLEGKQPVRSRARTQPSQTVKQTSRNESQD